MSGKSLTQLTAFLELCVGLKELQKTQRLHWDSKAIPARQHNTRKKKKRKKIMELWS